MAGTLYGELCGCAAPDPAQPFLVDARDRRWTYGDLDAVTARLAHRLGGIGLEPGDRLACRVEKSPEVLFLYLACTRAGITFVPLNPALRAAELGPILADTEPAALVLGPEAVETARSAAPQLAGHVFTLDAAGGGSLCENLARLPTTYRDVALGTDATAALMLTSGTTGRAKAAMMPHHHLAAKALTLADALEWQPGDRLIHALPLFHAHGLFMTTHCVLAAGASMLLLPRFDAAEVARRLPEATVFSGVPTMYARLLGEPGLCAEACRGVRLFVSASAPLPRATAAAFCERTGHALVECWGMTETMTNTASPLRGERRVGSVGLPLPGVEIRTVDAQGRVLRGGEAGTLEVRATTRFGGYWRRPEESRAAFRPDGFFVTGDIGRIEADGYVTILGRARETINTGGYKVDPREVELALEGLESVAVAAVFSLPHPDFGEEVTAAVEVEGPHRPSPDTLRQELKQRLAFYKIPRAIFVVDRLPRTALGKIQKEALRACFGGAEGARAGERGDGDGAARS